MRMMVKYIMAMDTWNRPLKNADEDESNAYAETTREGTFGSNILLMAKLLSPKPLTKYILLALTPYF